MARETETGRTVPIEKLGTMNRLGTLGIDGVRDRLQRLDAEGTAVESELVKSGYVTTATLDRTFDDEPRSGVRVKVAGTPNGHALVLFDADSAKRAAALMLSDTVEDLSAVDGEMARSALTELGGIMANGFLDAWADAFGESIDVKTPVPVQNSERDVVGAAALSKDGYGVYITSRLRLPEHGIVAQVYLFPRTETFVRLVNAVETDVERGD